MAGPKYPILYQVNTRVWLTELSRELGRAATLDDIPDEAIQQLSGKGFTWLYMLSVWTTGDAARQISLEHAGWGREFRETLEDLTEADIGGSGFAIKTYQVHPDLGGDEGLKHFRERLRKHGLKLMLDFVPNHLAPDHAWVEQHPDYFIHGTAKDLENNPRNYTLPGHNNTARVFAYGRDPYFDGWPDTLQLDYSNAAVTDAMTHELQRISTQCDGLRCDMAMLVMPAVFEKTWGRKMKSFWPEAIKAVKETIPDFTFMAEVYWEMEWDLQQTGFDYTYDKSLYDRLLAGYARPVREHFYAAPEYQDKLARFLENHDETRAAKSFEQGKHEAAAIITYLSPGLKFFHQGQLEGKKIKISPHLLRGPKEPVNNGLLKFYADLLALLKMPVFRNGSFRLIEPLPAWEGNSSCDSFLAFGWTGTDNREVLVCVNYASFTGQCRLHLPFPNLAGSSWVLKDRLNAISYTRNGDELLGEGLFLDMPAWNYHVFEISRTGNSAV